MMHDGLGIATGSPVGLIFPVFGSIRKTTTFFPGIFAHNNHPLLEVIARFCGPLPKLGSMLIRVNLPLAPME
jgi:hypothetical protein